MVLLFDVERCMGNDCAIRESCRRYVDRNEVGPMTPMRGNHAGMSVLIADECDSHILVVEVHHG